MYNECYTELEKIVYGSLKKKRKFRVLIGKGGATVLTPTKNLHEDKAILKIGARILSFLTSPRTLSSTWEAYFNFQNQESNNVLRIQFDLFILALDFLYIVGAIEYEDDLLWRANT
ncbi:ABC-three component system middle component 6 [Lysinibacillus sp. FSL W8-0953]|uniref:ABC-three component system middle component 6 n=1 Tax=Lysinibacillus sp. FSL W8-0953 TaxID=2954640 RepID=UPI0030FAC8CB